MLHRSYPVRNNVDEVLAELEAEDQREREALRRFYARNAAPHYSKIPRRFKQVVAVIGCLALIAAGAACLWLWMAL